MEERLRELLDGCRSASTLDAAAEVLVQCMADEVGGALERFALGRHTKVLRGLVHVRPDGGYRDLAVHELGRKGNGLLDGDTLLPSSTAWSFVERHRVPVAVDVHKGTLEGLGITETEVRVSSDGPDAFKSAAHISARQTSHLIALPLPDLSGNIAGMVALEASCLPGVGKPFVWRDCHARLQLLVDVAAPYLSTRSVAVADLEEDPLLPVVGEKMQGLVRLLRVFARQRESLLIRGPTGAGKSRLARWVHANSPRKDGPFEAVDLQTVPEEMQMPTLFGWARGAFTGATGDNAGSVGRAEGGTLFLDEIDKLSMSAQAGLLQLLEERQYRALGSSGGPRTADVRFVIGSNANLESAVREGRFRQDLFFRINVLPVVLPSLDERRDEIPSWASFMLARHDEEAGGAGPARLAAGTGALLQRRGWPGNLRQLDNVVRRAYAMALADLADGQGTSALLPSHVEQALAFEMAPGESRGVLADLAHAARGFAEAAQTARSKDGVLELDHADAFRGLVLRAAEQLVGSREEAFRLLGRGSLVDSRNHQKVFKREVARVLELAEQLGEDPALE